MTQLLQNRENLDKFHLAGGSSKRYYAANYGEFQGTAKGVKITVQDPEKKRIR